MNRLPYYKRFPRDFFESTLLMPLELKGAFGLILDLIYMHNGELLNDAGYISGLLGCKARQWSTVRDRLITLGKLQVRGDFLINLRADKELVSSHSDQEKQRQNGLKCSKINIIDEAVATPKSSQPEPEPEPELEPKTKKEILATTVLLIARDETATSKDFEDLYDRLLPVVGITDLANVPRYWQKNAAKPFLELWLSLLTKEEIITIAQRGFEKMPVAPQGPKALSDVMRAAWTSPTKPKSDSADPDAMFKFYADLMNGTKYLPQNAVSLSMQRDLVARGLVTREQLRLRGVP